MMESHHTVPAALGQDPDAEILKIPESERSNGARSLSIVPLAEARIEATRCRTLLKDRIDSIEAQRAERKTEQAIALRSLKIATADYMETQRPGWKNTKHAQSRGKHVGHPCRSCNRKMDVRDIGTRE